MPSRRSFLKTAGGATLALGLPCPALALPVDPAALKFVFVFATGGWDPTRVFASGFDFDNVDMEPLAEPAGAGNIDFVDHPDRPSVATFMELHHDKVLVLNGLLVRSISHEICTLIAMTGVSSGLDPDWPALLAATDRESYVLPHLVFGGPSYPGDLGVVVARAGGAGQLDALINREALAQSEMVVTPTSRTAEAVMDRYMARRTAARVAAAQTSLATGLTTDLDRSLSQARRLKDLAYVMSFAGASTISGQISITADALSSGVARCATLEFGNGWDSHADNDAIQSPLWESLFDGLLELVDTLGSTPGQVQPTLLDETCIVVLSEMGRTPMLNAFIGKDHWPFTSAMLIGAGFGGDRVVGAYTDQFFGETLDPATGDIIEDGETLSAGTLGATLLAMADIDPAEHVLGVEPLLGVLG